MKRKESKLLIQLFNLKGTYYIGVPNADINVLFVLSSCVCNDAR